ncbi:MAG TPA: helix-turn-helix domain-containing protein [Actinomycetota bacterium]
MRERRRDRSSDTRERLMQAAVETLGEEGIAGTTARAIAERGGFNQALIFYHFGSVPNLLIEAFRQTTVAQVARYRAAATEVSSLQDLVAIARRLHAEDLETGVVTAVTQLMAAASDQETGGAILDRFEEWIGLVQEALARAVAGSPLASLVPAREAAYAVSALFLGIELMSRLDPERSEAEAVFSMMANLARIIEEVAPAMLPKG